MATATPLTDAERLAADIARVAAKRGLTLDDVKRGAAELDLRSRTLHSNDIDDVFSIPAGVDVAAELEVLDRLPARSRRVLRELPLMTHAGKYADLLLRMRDEAALIAAVLERAAVKRGASWQPYGPDFPRRRRHA